MTFQQLSFILTSVTALAAVIGPVISSVINVRSNERTKKYEMYAPKLYTAVQKLTEAYAKFPRKVDFNKTNDLGRGRLDNEYASALRVFCSAAYEIMSLLPSRELHEQIISFLAELEGKRCIGIEQDQKFQQLTESLAVELSAEFSPMKKCIARKAKRSSRK